MAARIAFIGLKLKLTTMPVTVTSKVPIQPGVSESDPILPSLISNGKNVSSSNNSWMFFSRIRKSFKVKGNVASMLSPSNTTSSPKTFCKKLRKTVSMSLSKLSAARYKTAASGQPTA